MLEQLKNQDPTSPTDTNEYMSQMVSYAGFDKLSAISDSIDTITDSLNSFMSTSSLSYISSTLEAHGDTAMLSDGSASWGYDLEDTAAQTKITITDQNGDEVWSGSGEREAGAHSFTWDGTDNDGNTVKDGAYTISIKAVDGDGETVPNTTTVRGTVTGIAIDDDGSSDLVMGDVSVPFEDIVSINP